MGTISVFKLAFFGYTVVRNFIFPSPNGNQLFIRMADFFFAANIAAKCDKTGAVLHDTDGNVQFETAPRATVDYAYNAFNDLTAITRGDGAAYDLTYNAFHKLESTGLAGRTRRL